MIICIQSPPRLLMIQVQKSLTYFWRSYSGWGWKRISLVFSYTGGLFIQKGQWHANVNIWRLALEDLNATVNRHPETPNQIFEPMGLAEPRTTNRFTGRGLGLANQDTIRHVFRHFRNCTKPHHDSDPNHACWRVPRIRCYHYLYQISTNYSQLVSQLQWCWNRMQTHITIFPVENDREWRQPSSPPYVLTLIWLQLCPMGCWYIVAKTFGATTTDIYYPCYCCVTVASYRFWMPTLYFAQ